MNTFYTNGKEKWCFTEGKEDWSKYDRYNCCHKCGLCILIHHSTLFVMKGQNILASLLSIVEVYTYLMGLNIVLEIIDEAQNLIAYCLGWGSGVYLGSKIEQWLALGYITVQIGIDKQEESIPILLRKRGFGVTSWLADGRDGNRIVMQVLAKRTNEKNCLTQLKRWYQKLLLFPMNQDIFEADFGRKDYLRIFVLGYRNTHLLTTLRQVKEY